MDRSASKASVINLDDTAEAAANVSGMQSEVPAYGVQSLLADGLNISIPESSSGFISPQPEQSGPTDDRLAQDRGQLMQDVITQLESQRMIQDTSTSLPSGIPTNFPPQLPGEQSAPSAQQKVTMKIEAGRIQNPEDRRRCGWIPNQKTAHTLQTLPPSDRRLSYTMPGVLTEGNMADPIVELAKKHLGDVVTPKREVPADESIAGIYGLIVRIPEDSDGSDDILLSFQQSGNFRAAIDLSARLLGSRGQGWGKAHTPSKHTEETLTLWTHRFQMLLGIRYYSLACSEMETFGDLEAPDLFFQYYPETYHNRRGTLVPFSLRLMHAEMPRFSGNAPEALARCNHVISVVNRLMSNLKGNLSEDGRLEIEQSDKSQSLELWNCRLREAQYCLARTLLSMKEYHLSVSVYSALAESCHDQEEKCGIYSLLGRMKLQLGEYVSSTSWFQKFNATCDHGSAKMKALACLHKGFLSVFYGNYTDACQAFSAALQYEPKNPDAANNMAVCLLYEGKLDEAIEILERVVRDSPEMALREGVCTNLCTLYELATARSAGRKQTLLNMVAQSRGDSFTAACLKL